MYNIPNMTQKELHEKAVAIVKAHPREWQTMGVAINLEKLYLALKRVDKRPEVGTIPKAVNQKEAFGWMLSETPATYSY